MTYGGKRIHKMTYCGKYFGRLTLLHGALAHGAMVSRHGATVLGVVIFSYVAC